MFSASKFNKLKCYIKFKIFLKDKKAHNFLFQSKKMGILLKLANLNLYKIFKPKYSIFALDSRSSLSSLSTAKFDFDVNKFNDIHIKSNNVSKFIQETNSNLELFESTLSSIHILKNII